MSNTHLFDLNVSPNLANSQAVRDLAGMDPELLPFFAPTERAVIEVCMDIVNSEAVI